MCGRRGSVPDVRFEKTRLLQQRLLIGLSRKRLRSEELQQNFKQLWISVNKQAVAVISSSSFWRTGVIKLVVLARRRHQSLQLR